MNNLDDDGLASYFKEVQIDDVIEQYFAMESSKGKGKKKDGKFQDAECVGKLISRKKQSNFVQFFLLLHLITG